MAAAGVSEPMTHQPPRRVRHAGARGFAGTSGRAIHVISQLPQHPRRQLAVLPRGPTAAWRTRLRSRRQRRAKFECMGPRREFAIFGMQGGASGATRPTGCGLWPPVEQSRQQSGRFVAVNSCSRRVSLSGGSAAFARAGRIARPAGKPKPSIIASNSGPSVRIGALPAGESGRLLPLSAAVAPRA